MAMLGTFILAFGWFGFNPGSSLAGTELRITVVAVNTMLASATGALGATLWVRWVKTKKPDPSMMCNGMLAGLVAITCPPVAAPFGPAQVTPRPAAAERESLRSALESMARKLLSESRRPNQNA
jgi:Amt family ammonium transporter